MPWDAQSFQHNNHNLGIVRAAHAAAIANHVLQSTGSEAEAIRTAIAREKHRDQGGIVGPGTSAGSGGLGGVQPSAASANPMTQGMIQRYVGMPTEKLAELHSMLGNSPQGQIVGRLLQQKRMMPNPQSQQQPQAAPQQSGAPMQGQSGMQGQPTPIRRGGMVPHRDVGGGMSLSTADPWWTRAETKNDASGGSGFLAGSTPGRADALHTSAPGGAYVVPADVVAGLGEGNSFAGAKVIEMMLHSGPGGTPLPQGRAGHGPPTPPRPMGAQAKGGGVHGGDKVPGKPVPVALSHGEFVVAPEHVVRFGNGDLKRGHRWWDRWVQMQRKRQIEKLKKLPRPVGAKKETA